MALAAVAIVWTVAARLASPGPNRVDLVLVPVPGRVQPLDGAPQIGHPDAPIGLLVYSDLTCRFCRVFARESLPILRQKYVATGKLIVAFRHFPSRQPDSSAVDVSTIAACAADQNLFWELHDAVFQAPAPPTSSSATQQATQLGADRGALEECTAEPHSGVISDLEAASGLGLLGTPTILIGRQVEGGVLVANVVSGARSVDVFVGLLEELLRSGPG
jgi:protein-disulfide isomerase